MLHNMVIKIINVVVLMCLIQNNTVAQVNVLEKKISVSFDEENLVTIVKSIDKQLNGVFSYKPEIFPKNEKLTLNEENKTVKEILDKVFLGTKIGYREYGGEIILNVKSELKKVTVSGLITDKTTGELLIGANIFVEETYGGASSNQYGFYSVTLDEGRYSLVYSYLGYTKKILTNVELSSSLRLNIELEPTPINMEEVVVEDQKYDQNIKATEMGLIAFTPKSIESVPILFGEQDILKAMQLMPGVSTAVEGASGFYVRGGGIDQNQILLDEATVYNPTHLLGLFSTFNSDAIKNVNFIKGNFPSEYGGRLSSVMDIRMKEGSNKNFNVYGGIGTIASRLTVDGPIIKDKGSFIISGRRTYADILFSLFPDKDSDTDVKLYFYDLNAKTNFILGENDRIYLSGYFGRDVFSVEDVFGFNWGNTTTTLRWNHIFGDKLFMNLTGIYSQYDYDIEIDDQDNAMTIESGIQDINLKADFQYYLNDKNTFKFGLNVIKHLFSPGEMLPTGASNFNPIIIPETNAYESALYAGHDLKLGEKLNLNYGLRLSNYSIVGPGTVYSFNEYGEITENEEIDKGLIKSYNGIEPRISAVYLLSSYSSLKAAYSRNMQYLHLLSNATSGTPIDIWQSSTKNIKPGIADQYSVGYFHNFNENMFELSIEAYYKHLQNQIDFKNGAELALNEFVEGELVFGKGWSYGIELMFKKNLGNFTGWIGYTLSKTERQFPEIEDGEVFPAKQDRTHDISVIGMYKVNERWNLSFNWIYYTGNAVTFPNGKYMFENVTVNYYTQRNGYRMPDYHRMDIGATYNFSPSSSLTVSVYNVYARKNAWTIMFRENEDDPTQTEAVRFALFAFFPSITFNFNF